MNENQYLTDMPRDLVTYGICKTLMVRRETIYLKHILKNIFIYNFEHRQEILDNLNFSDPFVYFEFLTNKLRMIYKLSRHFEYDPNIIVKLDRNSIVPICELYQQLNPLFIVDFDKTLTKKQFHKWYSVLCRSGQVVVNSANPDEERISNYINKHDLPRPKKICANPGVKKKITRLKNLCFNNMTRPQFCFDDEAYFLDHAIFLGMYAYQIRNGKLHSYTFFRK